MTATKWTEYHKREGHWIGLRFGKQTVVSKVGETTYRNSTGKGKYKYEPITDILLIRCDCGGEREVTAKNLYGNEPKSCRLCAAKRRDCIGEISGSLIVRNSGSSRTKTGRSVVWLRCECLTCSGEQMVRVNTFLSGEAKCAACRKSCRFVVPDKRYSIKKYYTSIKSRCKKKNLKQDLSIEFLKNLLLSQDSRCALTKIDISVENGTASLDRRDNNLGYLQTNVQWVYRPVNYMKVDLPEEEFVRLCSLVSDNRRATLASSPS